MAAIDISSPASGGGGGGNLQLLGGASMTSTLTAVTDTSNVSSPLKLSTTAVQIESPLRITTSDASGFYLDAEDSATNNRFSIKRDPSSQVVTLDFASNPTGSTDMVGAIRTYVDGVNLSEVMTFREDANVGIGTTTPTTKLVVNSTATALNATFDALSTTTILGNQQSPLRVLRTAGQPNVYIGTSNETPDHSPFLAGIRTGAWYNTASPTYSGQFGAYYINRANQWGTQTSSADLRMAHNFTCNGTTGRQALFITPLLAESSTNTDYVAVNNLLVTTAAYFGTQPTARVQIVGDGSTSATTSLLVQNYSGTEALKVFDDGAVSIGGNTTIAKANLQIGSGFSGSLNFTNINFANWNGTVYGAMGGIDANNSTFIFGGTTINASAKVQFDSTTQGFLPPRMTTAQKLAIATPAAGLMIYDTDLNKLCVYTTAWETITSI